MRVALAAVTAALLAAAAGCGPGAHHDLAVTTFSPARTSDGRAPIEIRFDRPVVDETQVGTSVDDRSLTLAPAAPWHGRWEDRQTLVVEPDGALAPSTRYTVKLAGALAQRTGGFGFTFVHQPLAVTGLVGADAERLPTAGPWTLGFSLPVQGKAVAKGCALRGARGAVALTTESPDEVGTEITVRPARALPADVDYRMTCSGLGAAAGDAPMPEPWTLDVHTLSELSVRTALPDGSDVAADEVPTRAPGVTDGDRG
ncbi:MAG TPA: Ig-like domain-containing protein [Kofleriaceae bacterium]|nr:Ig-like domain-containing protein [Kofleriaceae bacterium]